MVDFGVARDPTTAMWRHLKRVLPERKGKSGEPFNWIHLHHLPDGWNPNHGVAVVVADDASQTRETAHDRAMVRVTVHAPTFDSARRWGRNIHTFLLSPFGGLGLGISRTRSTGVPVAPDSLAGGFVATASYSCGMSKFSLHLERAKHG